MKKAEKNLHSEICRRIRATAMERAVPSGELAKRAGVSNRLMYLTMKERANLRDHTIGKFAKALGVSAEYLQKGTQSTDERSVGKVISEGSDLYGSDPGVPETVNDAVELLAKQLRVPRPRILKMLCDLMLEKEQT